MKIKKTYLALFFLGSLCSCAEMSCMQQYNPKPFWNKLEQEEKIANRPAQTLTEDGKLKK